MTNRPIRVLLVDGQVEDSRWIQELLAELEESRFASGWMHGIEAFHLERLSDAITLLADATERERFDAVLLNPALPDSRGLHSYLRLQAVAPGLPILLLVEADDPDLAISMVRAGAQDYLVKTEIDCLPLARALRLALERSRVLNEARAGSSRDTLTGLSNRVGFLGLAEHDLALARRHSRPLAITVAELSGLERLGNFYGRDERELALVEFADLIRESAEAPAVAARTAEAQFAICLLPADEAEVALQAAVIQRRFQRWKFARANRSCLSLSMGNAWRRPGDNGYIADLLSRAEESLCENVGVASLGEEVRFDQLAHSAGRNL